MRPHDVSIVTDHELLQNVSSDQHHPSAASFRVVINSLAISATSAYELREDIGRTGCSTIFAVLRGYDSVDVQGHVGCVVYGSKTAAECSAFGIRPYGGGGYVSSYIGGFSRLHGDSYLTRTSFGNSIRLRDCWIDGTECVLEFYNGSSFSKNLTVYGTVVCK